MIEEIKKEIWKIREKTFTKKDKEGHMCNEWVDCLSFNDDILPLIKILDKYKKQEKQTTIFIDSEDMEERYGTQLYIEYLEEKLKKIEEYITSYESISTIQGLNDTKENKNLDKNTMVEMTNRYLKVHDKILSIIKGDE